MKKILFALLLLPFLVNAQATATDSHVGMKFEHGLSWKEIQAKAKADNKFIIMDCYTTWCGPCTYMTNNIFPLKEAGDFFNANYINVKVQFDSTKNDNEEVKSWFKDMEEINAKYKIRAYPTYLMFDPNGEVVHRAVGSSVDVKLFIEKGRNGMNPEKQYYTQLKKYENGLKDPAFLRNFALIAQEAYDMPKANAVSAEYIATITDLYTKENLDFIGRFTGTSKDKGFAIMMDNPEKVNAVLGANKAQERVFAILMQEEIYPEFNKSMRAKTDLDWTAVSAKVTSKYPALAPELLAKGKVIYYSQVKKDWNNFQVEVVAYMDKYGAKASAADLNSYAWNIFENCKDMTCVAQALEWSKRSFKDKQEPMYMDTYANILHKLGKTQEAIAIQEKAIALTTDEASKKSYQETLDKMKKGEKTWKEGTN